MTESKDWKSKYLKNLEEIDRMEKSWGELEDFLRKIISRLSTAAKGMDTRLDSVLKDIQAHARKKQDDRLKQDLDKLSQILTQIDDTPTTSVNDIPIPSRNDEQAATQLHFALDLIDQIEAGASSAQQEFTSLRSRLPSLGDDRCLRELASLINKLLQLDESKPDQRAQAFSVLIEMIERITLEYGKSQRLDRITQDLEAAGKNSDWHIFLDRIIDEIRDMINGINNEKIELEGLVLDVTRQLSEISSSLGDEQSENMQGHRATQELKDLVDRNVQKIQQGVDSAVDLVQIKSMIGDSLSSIKGGLQDFVHHDNERFEKAQRRNKILSEQIEAMELESEQLKHKLGENRKKLMLDSLTGVRNRLAYEETMEQELDRFGRYHEPFSYALLDIDHFKKINDTYGHNAGDKALQIVARLMQRHIRKTDFLFRIGGEEFVLLLPKTPLKNARPLIEKIRLTVGSAQFHFKEQLITITLSAGLTQVHDEDNAESIYERADKAMYQAKNSGRDRLVVVN